MKASALFRLIAVAAGFVLPLAFAQTSAAHGVAGDQDGKQVKEPLSEASKEWLEEVVPYIITDREKEVFLNLPTEKDRGQFIETFWKKRDPNPQTPENEFKLEYYRRIALANKFFGVGGIPGWRTDRGRFYILLGPPQQIERDMTPSASILTMSQGPKETWQYWDLPNPKLPYNLEFIFVDKFGTGNYVLEQTLNMSQRGSEVFDPSGMTFQFDYLETIAEATKNPFDNLEKLRGVITTQVTYNLIPFAYGTFSFKGLEKKTLIPLVVEIPYSSLPSKRSEFDYFFSLNLTVNVSNSLGQIVFEASKDFNFKKAATELAGLQDSSLRLQTTFSLEPGDYGLHLLVLDNYSGKVGTSHEPLSIADFSAASLAMSDIILFREGIQPEGQSGGKEEGIAAAVLHAESGRVFRVGDELGVFFEVYNLALDETTGRNKVRAEYVFSQADKIIGRIPVPPPESLPQKDCRLQTSFRLKNFKPGEYVLRAVVTDDNSGQSVSKDIPFSIVAPTPQNPGAESEERFSGKG